MKYTLIKNSMSSEKRRKGYNTLSQQTFGLDFENWYASGHFDGSHIPYTIFDGDTAVANISVNLMDVLYNGQIKRYIQLGTVMTDKQYRKQGLQRIIFDEIIADYSGEFDALFLFANKNVTEFYPKFGFEKTVEYCFEKTVESKECAVRKLDMANNKDVTMLKEYYNKGNSFSALEVKNGFALEMFYLGGPYADNVFYIEEYDAVVVAEKDDDTITCLDIFGGENYALEEIMSAFGCRKLVMGFTPKDIKGFTISTVDDEDTVLFVHSSGENVFAENRLLFPLIAHT